MGNTRSWVVRALCLCAFAASCSALGDELTERAQRLLRERRAADAYQLLLPQESARAGQPEFDYLLGIAALDAGAPERAVFALERVLAVQPDNHVARAEIARAYLALGERDAARREFQAVRSQPIPAQAKANIDRFLAAIQTAETTRIDGFIELGAGHDSNVNAATSRSQIALPALGGLIATLDPAFTKRADTFAALAGGVHLTHKLNPSFSVVGSAAGTLRANRHESRFDQATLDGSLGGRWAPGKDALTVAAQLQSFELDHERYRETSGIVAQWQHAYDERRQASVFGQLSSLRYPTQRIRDADRQVVGLAYGRVLGVAYAPVVFGSAYVGREAQRADGAANLGHRLWGARAGGELRLGRGWSVLGAAAYEERRYGGPEPLFEATRRDRQTDLSAGVSYLLRASTTVLGQIAHTHNRSNVELNRFDRSVATLSVRFSF